MDGFKAQPKAQPLSVGLRSVLLVSSGRVPQALLKEPVASASSVLLLGADPHGARETHAGHFGTSAASLSESCCLPHESRTSTFVEEDLRSSSCSGS